MKVIWDRFFKEEEKKLNQYFYFFHILFYTSVYYCHLSAINHDCQLSVTSAYEFIEL